MTDRPILFSGAMVRALLAGAKRQTRRALKSQDELGQAYRPIVRGNAVYNYSGTDLIERAKYQVGDRLWVRESFRQNAGGAIRDAAGGQDDIVEPGVEYMADARPTARTGLTWTPSIHMPRRLSRLTLPVTDVRIERLQDISEADALAEGVDCEWHGVPVGARESFERLWGATYGPDAWAKTPWVVAVSFDVIERNIDEVT